VFGNRHAQRQQQAGDAYVRNTAAGIASPRSFHLLNMVAFAAGARREA
jgi:hypothetical protein